MFSLWFATGFIMVFVPFPSLSIADRDAHSDRVAFDQVKASPAQILSAADAPDASLRLVSRLGHPVYVLTAGGKVRVFDAATGASAPAISAADAGKIAAAFAGTAVKSVAGPFAYDQWVVHQKFDPQRPFYRVALGDPAQTELYIAAASGEVVQKTTAAQRGWNTLGAVIHWLYLTPLRSHFAAWDQTVWWLSLAGLLTVAAGATLGVVRASKALKHPKKPRLTPFRGWLEWHHRFGLFAGVLVLSWIFSGWLSMDHGRLFSRGEMTAPQMALYQGATLPNALSEVPLSRLQTYAGATRLEFSAVAGRPVVAALGPSAPQVSDDVILSGLRAAWPQIAPARLESVPPDDVYALAEGLPLTAKRAHLSQGGTDVYVDTATGRVLVVMDPSRRAYAWIYYVLHTWNWPILAQHPAVHNTLVVILLLAGLGFSVTGFVLAFNRLRLSL